MANRISTIFDFSESGGLKKLKADVAAADTTVGKLKAGWSNATSSIKANAGAIAVGAGASLVAFGVKAVSAFTDGALAAGKFADATGLATDDASRWIEVASDVGVSAETMQSAFVKLEKAVAGNSPAFQQLGIDVKQTADGTVDANATMVAAIETLNGIEDPAKRAEAASMLFGKGFAQAAEIVLGDADKVKAALEGVSSAQVFDDSEVAKAREFRASMDDLKDKLEGIALALGERLVPATVTAVEGIEKIGAALDALGLDDLFDVLDGNAEGADAAVSSLVKTFESGEASAADMANAFGGLVQAEIDATGGAEALGEVLTSDSLFGGTESEVDAMTDAFSKLAKRSPETAGAVTNSMKKVLAAANAGNATAQQWVDKWGLSADVTDAFTDILREEAIAADASSSALGGATDATGEMGGAADDAAPSVQEMADKVEDARDAAGKLATELPLTNAQLRNLKEDADAAWKGVRDLKDQFALLRGELTDETAYLDLQDGFDAVQTAAEDAYIAAAEGAEDAEQKGRDYRQEILRQKERIIDFAEAVGTIPPETVAEILTQLDEGKLAEAEARIALLTATRQVSIIPVMGRAPTGAVVRNPNGTNQMIAGATGGIVNRPTMALIGEAGPEAVIPLNRSRGNGPLPAGLGGGAINLTINAGVNADGPEIARIIANKLREYQRFNGPGR